MRMRLHPLFLSLLLPFAAAPALAAPPSDAEVGDAASFGKNAKWLGLVAGSVYLDTDCTGDTSGTCVTLNPAPAVTTFRINDLDSIALPKKSTESMLCHWQTPIVAYSYSNYTGTDQYMQFRAYPIYRVRSKVLDDPTLIDPGTGLPFNGEIELPLSGVSKFGLLPNGSYQYEQDTSTRTCIAGLISAKNLELGYGLTPQQVKEFFKGPITIHLDIAGTVQMVDSASIYFGTRFLGD